MRSQVQLVRIENEQDIVCVDGCFIVDRLNEISYRKRMWLSNQESDFLIILKQTISVGLDQPNERIDWIGTVETADSALQTVNESKDGSKHVLDLYYPNWTCQFVKELDATTILIPPCADVEKSFTNKDESGIVGRDAERIIVRHLTGLKIGGILLTGVESKKFIKAHCIKTELKFEFDALFFHDKFGIIVFECKSADIRGTGPLKDRNRIKKACKQLRILGSALHDAYASSSKQELSKHLIYYVIVLPNSTRSDEEKQDFETLNKIAIWDQVDLEPANLFGKLSELKEKIHTFTTEDLDLLYHDPLKNFAKKTAGARKLSFISPKHNVLAINEIITSQMHIRDNAGTNQQQMKSYGYCEVQDIFLSREQENVLYDASTFQLISGPPGTGKTLLMLLKVLNLVKNGDSDLVINIQTECFGALMDIRRFLDANLTGAENKRIVLHESQAEIWKDNPTAFFADELILTGKVFDIVKDRKHCAMPTFLCISGAIHPVELFRSNIEHTLDIVNDGTVRHRFLSTVYRGTENIVKAWRTIYDTDASLHIGHFIKGFDVEEHERTTFREMLELLLHGIEQFQTKSSTKADRDRAVCAVLVNDIAGLDSIRAFLASAGIACGTALEHARNPTLVSVDWVDRCLSMEWPIVFYMEYLLQHFNESKRFIASSRAMVKLVILKRDHLTLANKYEKTIGSYAISITSKMTYMEHCLALEAARQIAYAEDYKELVDICRDSDTLVIALRFDYWPSELRQYPIFNAASFYDAASKISKNSDALFKMIIARGERTQRALRDILGLEGREKTDMPACLKILWNGQPPEIVNERWTICHDLCVAIASQMGALVNCNVADEIEKLSEEFADNFNQLIFMSNHFL